MFTDRRTSTVHKPELLCNLAKIILVFNIKDIILKFEKKDFDTWLIVLHPFVMVPR